MLKTYFLIALRSLKREKVYVVINILGLSLALACAIILGLYIRSELSYDKHNVDHERIARIVSDTDTNGQSDLRAIVSPALGPLIARNYSHLGEYVRFRGVGNDTVLRTDDVQYAWDSIQYVDSNVFEVFTHQAVYGDLQDALSDPSSIVVSESLAKSYWGESNPLGQTLTVNADQYQVSAVFADLPETTHLKYDALLSYDILLASFGKNNDTLTPGNLLVSMGFTYFKVPEGFALSELEQTLNQFYTDVAEDPGKNIGMHITYRAQALADVHYDEGWEYDEPTGNRFYLFGFSAVAVFILLIACINYTNLATARATKRSKEVGMRKVIGAGRKQLMGQFMAESLLYTAIAFCLSIVIVEMLEVFTQVPSLVGKQELFPISQNPSLFFWLAGLALGVGFVSGIYPAFYLSSMSPKAALSAEQRGKMAKFSLRELLVLVQFFVSIAVIASTLLMAMQMQFIADKPLGFERDNRLFMRLRGADVLAQLPVIRNELLKNPNVINLAESSFVPGGNTRFNSISVESNDGQMEDGGLWVMSVSKEFFDVMGMKIALGRDFSQDVSDAGASIIVNEAFVKKMNWDDPLGKRIELRVTDIEGRVVGVVNDFNFASLRQSVQPVAIYLDPQHAISTLPGAQPNNVSRPIIIQISGDDVAATIKHIESVITRFAPNLPFEYTFFDDALSQLYRSEENLMALTGIFSAICILISSMGLYGLSAFNTEQRTKEIGIRKVLGASTARIIVMLAEHHIVLIIISGILASLASYWAIDSWLMAFAYRTDIATWVFFVSAFVVAAIAFVTIALQSAKTAQSNPVTALRFE